MAQATAALKGGPAQIGKLAGLVIELAAILLVIYYFQLESQGFFHVAALASVGFVIHYFLPFEQRLPFFLFLSLAAVAVIFGWQAIWLIGIGLVLIGVCHLPVPISVRVGLLVAIGASLAVMRAGWIAVPWSAAIWPILGSMFMFRLILYVYDSRRETTPATWPQRLAYFFLLPNVVFPLFPVVDYKTYLRTYYSEERHRIYQLGVIWIFRGLTQLVFYRLVYYYLSMSPTEVEDLGDMTRYVISGFLLYLRISGQFHIIVGLLRLFGFNLPETHHLYFLSTSFTDFWRRINIYWKDFMMKLFFYPAFFRLRKRGETTALLASTALVFFATWVLHAYQWFWIRGSYLLAWHDVMFWTLLAVLVMVNTVYESRHGTVRLVSGQAWTVRRAVGVVLRTASTFAVICLLWSLWTGSSMSEWFGLWRTVAANPTVGDARLIPAAILGVIGFAVVTLYFAVRERKRLAGDQQPFAQSAGMVVASAAALCLFATPNLYAGLIPSSIGPTYAALVTSTRELRLSGHDADMLQRGYYEDLLSVQSFNTQLWEVYSSWPLNWSRLEDTGVLHLTGDFLKQDLVPSMEIHFRNATLKTNRWGMRDKEYTREVPPNTHRFAMVGSSHVMGYGVDDGQTFEALLETKLNAARAPGAEAVEILNFAVDGYNPLQELRLLETRVFDFSPRTLLYVAHYGAPYRSMLHLAEMARSGIEIPYPELREMARRADVHAGTGRFESEQRLTPFQNELLAWTYRRMVELCKAHGVAPVWVYLPQVGDVVDSNALAHFEQVARDAGFTTVSLADAFDGHPPNTIWFGEWDRHPNANGHKLIADDFFKKLHGVNATVLTGPTVAPSPGTASRH